MKKKMMAFALALVSFLMFAACGMASSGYANGPGTGTNVHEVGETVATDIVEFTLDEICFTDTVSFDHANWFKPTSYRGGNLSAGDGYTFVWFSFTAKNLAKQDLSGYAVCTARIDYNHGYTYGNGTYSSSPGWSTNSFLTNNVGLSVMGPLAKVKYYGYISCVEDVRTDRESPLLLIVSLPSSIGMIDFAYNFAVSEEADTSEEARAISEAFHDQIDGLTFIKKYAGNTNSKGSRKFDDTFLKGVRNALADIDVDYINASLPETAEKLPTIQANVKKICDLIVKMGKTNSGKDVNTIKSLAGDTISMIEGLLSSELSAFN